MSLDGLTCGAPLPDAEFEEVRVRALFECFKWNVEENGGTRLCRFPLILDRELEGRLSEWAVALDTEARRAESELLARTDLYAALGLPLPLRMALRRATHESAGRYARYDFHPVEGGGFAVTEGNVDVAGGFNEASGVTKVFAAHVPDACAAGDPAAALAACLRDAVGRGAAVGCMYLTNFVDDHQVARFLGECFKEAGLAPVLFGPSQLRWRGSHACARVGKEEVRLDAVFRFFPADWLPRLGAWSRWWRVFGPGATLWTNPPTTVLTQSKRFPLTWSRLNAPLCTWRRFLPETRSPRDVEGGTWVIKPALAHEGFRVGMAGVTGRSEYDGILRDARWFPRRWAAQRRFLAAALPTPDGPRFPCVGVYVVDGQPAGLYGRLAARPLIDDNAQDVVVLVRRQP
jgi:hypothetical protein